MPFFLRIQSLYFTAQIIIILSDVLAYILQFRILSSEFISGNSVF